MPGQVVTQDFPDATLLAWLLRLRRLVLLLWWLDVDLFRLLFYRIFLFG